MRAFVDAQACLEDSLPLSLVLVNAATASLCLLRCWQILRLRNCQVGYYNNVHVASFLPESNHTLPHLKYNYVMGDVSACGGGGGRWAGTTWTKED